jgi:HEAT repeat protein
VKATWLIPALLVASCGPTIKADFNSPEPAARNAAIVKAAESRDQHAVPDLVRMLDSDDPATRLLAINALERITGQTLGYDFAATEFQRRAAADRWQKWVEDHPRSSTSTSQPPVAVTSSSGVAP